MENIDLILIRPSNWALYPKGERKTFLEPLGIEYIASQCVAKGFSVHIIDMDLNNDDDILIKALQKYKARYIGVSVTSPLVYETTRVISVVRDHSDAKIIVGGPHVSALMDKYKDILETIGADIYVGGEGELAVAEILGSEDFKEKFIWGTRLEDANQYVHPSRQLIDRAKLYLNHDFEEEKQVLASVITSRSCPYQCIFCASKSIFGRKLRLRDIPDIKKELEGLKELGVNTLIFLDDTFTINKKRTLEMCEVIKELGFSYWLDTRVDAVDEEVVIALKESGCKFICFGVEAGSPTILKRIKKGIKIKQVKEACELTNKYGIATQANFMIGHPGENIEHVMSTIKVAHDLPVKQVSFYKVIPLPGTQLFEMLDDEKKSNFTDFAWYKNPPIVSNMTNEQLEELQKIGYNFVEQKEQNIQHVGANNE